MDELPYVASRWVAGEIVDGKVLTAVTLRDRERPVAREVATEPGRLLQVIDVANGEVLWQVEAADNLVAWLIGDDWVLSSDSDGLSAYRAGEERWSIDRRVRAAKLDAGGGLLITFSSDDGGPSQLANVDMETGAVYWEAVLPTGEPLEVVVAEETASATLAPVGGATEPGERSPRSA